MFNSVIFKSAAMSTKSCEKN